MTMCSSIWYLMALTWFLTPNHGLKAPSNSSSQLSPFQSPSTLSEASEGNVSMAKTAQNISMTPVGCKPGVDPIYFRLCDLRLAWGIVLETMAALGILCTVILGVVFLALAPLVTRDQRSGVLVINFMFLMGVFGLFSLVFAFVVVQHEVNCSVRRFLFGVLFALCFSCLVAHAVRLNYLVWRNHGPRSCAVFLLAVCLFLVETVINMEWLLITNVRHNPLAPDPSGSPCNIAKTDFVMALVYVMFLIAGTLVSACSVLHGNYRQWKRHGVYILVTTALSVAIWATWIVMYLYGNEKVGSQPAWDDPVLAIAIVSNGWTFLLFYFIPELMEMAKPRYQYEAESSLSNHWLSQFSPSIIFDNKAFSMEDENQQEGRGPAGNSVSLYGNFSAQVHVLHSNKSREIMCSDTMSQFNVQQAQTEECWICPPRTWA
ncbi:G-protein coupled receptor family C group 5 member C-like [Lissotriton helveticus]